MRLPALPAFLAKVFTGLLLIPVLSGCTPVAVAEPFPTATPTVVSSPTATIVWFPPTPTRAPASIPTVAPTPEMRPGVGAITLEDPFDGTGSRWPVARTGMGSVAYGNDQLTLAVSQAKGALISLSNEPALSDFYAEITTQASLCRGNDQYGLLLRASSERDFYRLLINCNGFLRLERANNGSLALVQDWTPSGQAPPGSPLELRVGVWAVGKEMRVFINGVYQFSATDPLFTSGRIGLFARSAGSTPLTVSFSDLVVRAVDPASPAIFPPETPLPLDTGDQPPQATALPALLRPMILVGRPPRSSPPSHDPRGTPSRSSPPSHDPRGTPSPFFPSVP